MCLFVPVSDNATDKIAGGPRRCIGEPLAIQETMTALCVVLRFLSFSLVPNQRIESAIALTLEAKYGIRYQVRKRDL